MAGIKWKLDQYLSKISKSIGRLEEKAGERPEQDGAKD